MELEHDDAPWHCPLRDAPMQHVRVEDEASAARPAQVGHRMLRAHVLVCVPRAEVAKVGGVVQSVVRARGYLRRVRLRRDVVDKR